MSITDADRARAAAALNYGPDEQVSPMDAEYVDAVAQALADERERTLASCYGRHEALSLPVTAPGLVTCDGHELRWTAP